LAGETDPVFHQGIENRQQRFNSIKKEKQGFHFILRLACIIFDLNYLNVE
jgi:hypothetical protein